MPQDLPERYRVKRQPVALTVTADVVAYVTALVTGFSLLNGLWPSAVLAPGPMSRFLPFMIWFGVTIGLGSVWKVISHNVARTRSPFAAVAWLALAVCVLGAAVGTSGRYMAALVDGASAIQSHMFAYTRDLDAAARASERRGAVDRALIDLSAADGSNLRSTQDAERRYGVISKKAGDKGVTDVLGREAEAFERLTTDLRSVDNRRAGYLAQGNQQISEARAAAARSDEPAFVTATTAAVRLLKQANGISLLDSLGGFGAGMVTDAARGPFEQAKREVDEFASSARERQLAVDVPVFMPMADKDAVLAYPPLAAWILSVMIESFPFLMVICLLVSNLDGMKPTLAPAE